MKKTLCVIVILLCANSLLAQNFSVKSGNEFKLPRNQSMPMLIGIDETGIYMATYQVKRKYLQADHSDNIYTLMKYSLDNKELYKYEYGEEIDKSEVSDFLFFKSGLLMITHEVLVKQKKIIIYAGYINKETGRLKEKLTLLKTINYSSREALQTIRVVPTTDSTGFVLTVHEADEENQLLETETFDLSLKKTNKLLLTNKKSIDLYKVTQILPAPNNTMIVHAKNFEADPKSKKNRRKFLQVNSSVEIYDSKSQYLFTLKPEKKELYAVSQKVYVVGNNVFVIGLYDVDPLRKKIKGIFLDKFDLSTGSLLSSSNKELGKNSLALDEQDKSDEDDLNKYLRIRKLEINPVTNTPVVLAEIFSIQTATSSRDGEIRTTVRLTNADLFLIETTSEAKISRIQVLPKMQYQTYNFPGRTRADESWEDAATALSGISIDFYSSFSSFFFKDKLVLFFNDHLENGNVKTASDKPKLCRDMTSSVTYALTYDFKKGTFTRKMLFSNDDAPIPIIKEATLLNNEVYMYARQPSMLGKSSFKIIKVTMK